MDYSNIIRKNSVFNLQSLLTQVCVVAHVRMPVLRRRRQKKQTFKVILSYIVGMLGHMRPCLKQGTTKIVSLIQYVIVKAARGKKELESYFSLPIGKQPVEPECVLALDMMPLSLLLPKRIYFSTF